MIHKPDRTYQPEYALSLIKAIMGSYIREALGYIQVLMQQKRMERERELVMLYCLSAKRHSNLFYCKPFLKLGHVVRIAFSSSKTTILVIWIISRTQWKC